MVTVGKVVGSTRAVGQPAAATQCQCKDQIATHCQLKAWPSTHIHLPSLPTPTTPCRPGLVSPRREGSVPITGESITEEEPTMDMEVPTIQATRPICNPQEGISSPLTTKE